MLKFDDQEIPGPHGPVIADPPAIESQRTKYFGLEGESEIIGAPGGRKIIVDITLYSREWTDDVAIGTFLSLLDDQVGRNGTLEESGTCTTIFRDCTFVGFMPSGMGKLPDVAKTLDPQMSVVAWFTRGTLHFYQNSRSA